MHAVLCHCDFTASASFCIFSLDLTRITPAFLPHCTHACLPLLLCTALTPALLLHLGLVFPTCATAPTWACTTHSLLPTTCAPHCTSGSHLLTTCTSLHLAYTLPHTGSVLHCTWVGGNLTAHCLPAAPPPHCAPLWNPLCPHSPSFHTFLPLHLGQATSSSLLSFCFFAPATCTAACYLLPAAHCHSLGCLPACTLACLLLTLPPLPTCTLLCTSSSRSSFCLPACLWLWMRIHHLPRHGCQPPRCHSRTATPLVPTDLYLHNYLTRCCFAGRSVAALHLHLTMPRSRLPAASTSLPHSPYLL